MAVTKAMVTRPLLSPALGIRRPFYPLLFTGNRSSNCSSHNNVNNALRFAHTSSPLPPLSSVPFPASLAAAFCPA
ncbi:unnamed protein product [Closterium sp. NIES-54]